MSYLILIAAPHISCPFTLAVSPFAFMIFPVLCSSLHSDSYKLFQSDALQFIWYIIDHPSFILFWIILSHPFLFFPNDFSQAFVGGEGLLPLELRRGARPSANLERSTKLASKTVMQIEIRFHLETPRHRSHSHWWHMRRTQFQDGLTLWVLSYACKTLSPATVSSCFPNCNKLHVN